MREIVLGTAGHVDHGKTSLVRALTGIETDRLKEEKKRGITIELGFAFMDLPCGHRLGIIDVPGHEKFVKNMVAGAAGIDLVAFVIAADEGIMPQTREHFEICSLLGVKQGLIIITKTDMVEQEWLEMVQEEVRDYFADSFLAEAPMAAVSSTTGQGIVEVKELLDSMVRSSEFNQAHGPFRLPVDRIFSMKGFGAVVTGTSISGRLQVGDEICIYPDQKKARVRGIQVHGKEEQEVEAGRRTAINIQGLDTEMIDRGDMLATAGSLDPSYMLDCNFLYLSANKKNLKNRARVRVHLGTAEIMGRVVILEAEEAIAGEQYNVQVLLEEPVTAWPGDHYVVRSYSPVRTIGGGVILNAKPGKKRRRFKDINQSIFELYHQGTPEDHALFLLKESGFMGLTFAQLEVRLGIFGKRLKKILNQPISARKLLVVDSESQRMVSEEIYLGVMEFATSLITDFHKENPMKEGMAKEELRSRLYQGLEPKLFHLLINGLVKNNTVVQDKALIRLASHQISLQADAESVKKEMEQFYLNSGLQPPTKKELATKFTEFPAKMIKEVADLLHNENILVKVSEDLSFHPQALNQLRDKLLDHLNSTGEVNAQDFKTLSGVSRKFTIPLMEYFDRTKVTIRVGEKRILRK